MGTFKKQSLARFARHDMFPSCVDEIGVAVGKEIGKLDSEDGDGDGEGEGDAVVVVVVEVVVVVVVVVVEDAVVENLRL